MKSVFDVAKRKVIEDLKNIPMEVLEYGIVEKTLEDGSIQKNIKFLVEIPKGK